MTLWTKLLFQAGKRLAVDASVRGKVAEAYRETVKPGFDRTREDVRRISAETDPKENPSRFAGRLVRSLIDRTKDAKK